MGYYSPSHSAAHEEPKPKPYQYGLVGRFSSHPSPAASALPSASSPELPLHHSYGSLPYKDVPYSEHQRPSSFASQNPRDSRDSRFYGHSSTPSFALYQGHSRTPTGNSTTPLLAGHLNTSEFGQVLNAPRPSGSRPSTAGRYDSAYSHEHQQSTSLPPGAAAPLMRQSWPNQPDQSNPQHHFPQIPPIVDNSLQSRNRSSSNVDLRHRNAESFSSSKRLSVTTAGQDLARVPVSQGVPPSSWTGAPLLAGNESQTTRVGGSGTTGPDNTHSNRKTNQGQVSLIDDSDEITPTLERPHNSVLYVVNATSPRSVPGNLPS